MRFQSAAVHEQAGSFGSESVDNPAPAAGAITGCVSVFPGEEG
jgi:hypothetical protein